MGWVEGLVAFPPSALPSHFMSLSCRSTGVWPSISVSWVRETGGCLPPAPRSAELPSSTQGPHRSPRLGP